MKQRYRIGVRIALAVVTGFLTAYILLVFVGWIGGRRAFSLASGLFEAISGVTPNTNTSDRGGDTLWNIPVLILSICGGLAASALVMDHRMSSSKTELTVTLLAFIGLASFSGVNFWVEDTLISVAAQAVIDLFLCFFGLVTAILIWRWKAVGAYSIASRTILLFLVTTFGFVLPLFYLTSFLMSRMGNETFASVEFSKWPEAIAGIVGLVAALASLKKAKAEEN